MVRGVPWKGGEAPPRGEAGEVHAGALEARRGGAFLSDPTSGRYFEFNLSPNGAWWSCEFSAPRVRAEEVEIAFPEVATFAELAPNGGWVAAMAIPRDLLEARLNFGEGSKLNVTFILGTPEQRFLSAAKLGEGEPDFHRPERFTDLVFADPPPMSS